MRNLLKQHGKVTINVSGSVGRVRRRYPVVASAPGMSSARAPDRIRSAQPRGEVDAHALRAFAANGFGDAAIGHTEPHLLLDSAELYHRARAHRSYQLREIVKAALQALADLTRRTIVQWQRRQRARATYVALRALDTRTLRDLGFHRGEILSVAAEVAGIADSTRVRLVPARSGRPF